MDFINTPKPLVAPTTAERGLSAGIWGRLPIQKWAVGVDGYFSFDDFRNFSKHVSAQNVQQYASYIDTGVTIQQLASTTLAGIARVTHDGTDNDESSIITGGNAGCEVLFPSTPPARFLAFEARVAKSTIATDGLGFMLGLSEEGRAVADQLVDDTLVAADKDFLGFGCVAAAGATVNFGFKTAGQTAVVVAAAVATMVAATFVKLGFLIDMDAPTDKRGRIFVNGVEQSTYLTDTQIALATFPSAQGASRLWATKIGTASAFTMDMDWWAVGEGY